MASHVGTAPGKPRASSAQALGSFRGTLDEGTVRRRVLVIARGQQVPKTALRLLVLWATAFYFLLRTAARYLRRTWPG
ncbi:hypothetical protein, partial [Streptomyces sp. HB2AG]|uniref:hypothetical protein n=1 Tax=Streptomyces sp. HB2AG TaxID=2983400 RepID=UPI0022AB2D57